MSEPAAAPPLTLITGLSGAGRSTAIDALEDLGWETVDNLPLALIPRLAAPSGEAARPLALGVDTRTRGFTPAALRDTLATLRRRGRPARLVFLDADDAALIRRFAETRRRHHLAPTEGAAVGLARERAALDGLREVADAVIDTTATNPHELKARIRDLFAADAAPGMTVLVQSFSYRRGAPGEADWVLDARFLRNPHWREDLRPFDGRDHAVDAHVVGDPLFAPFLERARDLALLTLPAYQAEGKAYFCIAIGCTGGRHRSVAMAERLACGLTAAGWRVNVRHRELVGAADAREEAR